MRLLFIGGTGLISSACVELALQKGMEVTLLNRAASMKYPPAPPARACSPAICTPTRHVSLGYCMESDSTL